MAHTVTPKDNNKRVVLITLADPYDFRNESAKVTEELHTILGDVNQIVYLIYDVSKLSITFSDIVSGVTGFARQSSTFEKQLNQYSRVVLVGTSTLINISAGAASRFSPERPFPVFKTVEEALNYAQAELAKQ